MLRAVVCGMLRAVVCGTLRDLLSGERPYFDDRIPTACENGILTFRRE
jgi:uncharacterized membrane protein YeiH